MEPLTWTLQAIGLFMVTNIDDVIVLSLFYARGAGPGHHRQEVLERWEQVLFPIVLVGLGIVILVEGGAFGL